MLGSKLTVRVRELSVESELFLNFKNSKLNFQQSSNLNLSCQELKQILLRVMFALVKQELKTCKISQDYEFRKIMNSLRR